MKRLWKHRGLGMRPHKGEREALLDLPFELYVFYGRTFVGYGPAVAADLPLTAPVKRSCPLTVTTTTSHQRRALLPRAWCLYWWRRRQWWPYPASSAIHRSWWLPDTGTGG